MYDGYQHRWYGDTDRWMIVATVKIIAVMVASHYWWSWWTLLLWWTTSACVQAMVTKTRILGCFSTAHLSLTKVIFLTLASVRLLLEFYFFDSWNFHSGGKWTLKLRTTRWILKGFLEACKHFCLIVQCARVLFNACGYNLFVSNNLMLIIVDVSNWFYNRNVSY